jgi:imidazolonepropionase-like amidohydrolase
VNGAESFVLREANVLDEVGSFSGPLDVHVARGHIVAVGAGLHAEDVPSFDFSELFLLPGVFDCHDHVSLSTVAVGELLRTPVTQWAIEAAKNARLTLESGVTFVRDLCGADRGLRDAIDLGFVPGCRLQIAVVMICQTGGHGDFFLAGPGMEWSLIPDYPGRPSWVVDGPEEMREAVRATLRAGTD